MLKIFCKHKWNILNKTEITHEYGWYKTVYILVCENAVRLKKLKLNNLTFS